MAIDLDLEVEDDIQELDMDLDETIEFHNETVIEGTKVLVNGQFVDTFETDTKLDKTQNTSKIYATDANGKQVELKYNMSANGHSVVQRMNDGNILLPAICGGWEMYAVHGKYVTEQIAKAKEELSTTIDDKLADISMPTIEEEY